MLKSLREQIDYSGATTSNVIILIPILLYDYFAETKSAYEKNNMTTDQRAQLW
jgi:hypothetical protein